MTSRQRLLAAMRFEKVDRVPVAPFTLGALDPDSETAAELIRKTDPFITTGRCGRLLLRQSLPEHEITAGRRHHNHHSAYAAR